MTTDGADKLYFALETKSSLSAIDLRGTENMKIHRGKEHFKALEADVTMQVVADCKTFKTGR